MNPSTDYVGDDLFVSPAMPLPETAAERGERKPNGTSDQGYKED